MPVRRRRGRVAVPDEWHDRGKAPVATGGQDLQRAVAERLPPGSDPAGAEERRGVQAIGERVPVVSDPPHAADPARDGTRQHRYSERLARPMWMRRRGARLAIQTDSLARSPVAETPGGRGERPR